MQAIIPVGAFLQLLLVAAVFGSEPGYLGVRPKIDPAAAHCVAVEFVDPDGPAAAAGIEPGDILLRVNGAAFDCGNLQKGKPLVQDLKAGDSVVFEVLRGGKPHSFTARATPLPAKLVASQEEAKAWTIGKGLFSRFLKTGEVFSITKLPDGKFKAEGQFSAEEAKYLLLYFEKSGTLRGFDYQKVNERVAMTVRKDPVTQVEKFEFANRSVNP